MGGGREKVERGIWRWVIRGVERGVCRFIVFFQTCFMNMIFDTFSSLVRFATVLAGEFHSNVIFSMIFHMVFFS